MLELKAWVPGFLENFTPLYCIFLSRFDEYGTSYL